MNDKVLHAQHAVLLQLDAAAFRDHAFWRLRREYSQDRQHRRLKRLRGEGGFGPESGFIRKEFRRTFFHRNFTRI
jgi:hypothetical protein